jgi:hypothetical protein
MRYLALLLAVTSIATIKTSPIDDLRKRVDKLETDLQAEVSKNNDLRKRVDKLEDKLQDEVHKQNELRVLVAKLKKKSHKLKARIVKLEHASHIVLEVMPDFIKTVEGTTITLSQPEFSHLVSLIPLQSITPNIELNGATYTIEISNILWALTAKITSILG